MKIVVRVKKKPRNVEIRLIYSIMEEVRHLFIFLELVIRNMVLH